jgi:UDP-N-acetylglucosamine acyltransferase
MIHSTAVIHPKARVGNNVKVGPYAVIDEEVTIGNNCELGPHVYLTGNTTIGQDNKFHPGCVIGDSPQDLRFSGGTTKVVIGDQNVFREHVTVHRSNSPDEATRIGSKNYLMAHSHVGHNTVVGDHVIIANGALLAGHVTIQDRAFISGNCLVHQFVRVGTLAFMQGGAAISKDLPPFTIAWGDNRICGLNIIGIRRAGFNPEERLALKRLYHTLFRRTALLQEALGQARLEFHGDKARLLIDFVAAAKRGVCTDSGSRISVGD